MWPFILTPYSRCFHFAPTRVHRRQIIWVPERIHTLRHKASEFSRVFLHLILLFDSIVNLKAAYLVRADPPNKSLFLLYLSVCIQIIFWTAIYWRPDRGPPWCAGTSSTTSPWRRWPLTPSPSASTWTSPVWWAEGNHWNNTTVGVWFRSQGFPKKCISKIAGRNAKCKMS